VVVFVHKTQSPLGCDHSAELCTIANDFDKGARGEPRLCYFHRDEQLEAGLPWGIAVWRVFPVGRRTPPSFSSAFNLATQHLSTIGPFTPLGIEGGQQL
jgi:hypothetical protein